MIVKIGNAQNENTNSSASIVKEKFAYAQIEKKVKEMTCNLLGLEPEEAVRGARLLQDLGADELDMIEIILVLEKEFTIIVPDEYSDKLFTLNYIIRLAQKLLLKEDRLIFE